MDRLFRFANGIQIAIRTDEESIAVDGRTGIERATVSQIVGCKEFKSGFGGHDKELAVSRDIVDFATGELFADAEATEERIQYIVCVDFASDDS